MFYTGLDPLTMEEVYIPKTKEEKAMQRALLQFKNPKNYNLVYDALIKAGREDLIGNGPKCLIQSKETRYIASQHGKSKTKGKGHQRDNKGSKSNRNSRDNRKGRNSNNQSRNEETKMYKGKKSRGPAKLRLKKKR